MKGSIQGLSTTCPFGVQSTFLGCLLAYMLHTPLPSSCVSYTFFSLFLSESQLNPFVVV